MGGVPESLAVAGAIDYDYDDLGFTRLERLRTGGHSPGRAPVEFGPAPRQEGGEDKENDEEPADEFHSGTFRATF